MITFEHVTKTFDGVKAIDDLSLTIDQGEFTVVIGASGSGKSSALKMINRLLEHDSGRILFAGREIRSFRPEDLRRRMGEQNRQSARDYSVDQAADRLLRELSVVASRFGQVPGHSVVSAVEGAPES